MKKLFIFNLLLALGISLLNIPEALAEPASCTLPKKGQYLCERKFGWFEDRVPTKPIILKISHNQNNFNWSFSNEVGFWVLDNQNHYRRTFTEHIDSVSNCEGNTILGTDRFSSGHGFAVIREFKIDRSAEAVLKVTFSKYMRMNRMETDDDTSTWKCRFQK